MTGTARSAFALAVLVAVGAVIFWVVWPAGVVRAGDGRDTTSSLTSALMPRIPKALQTPCVASPEYMLRNHMTLLLDKREDIVRLGERQTKFRLERCLTCHAVKGADGKPVSYSNPRHFCRVCHDTEAVSIDCFQCHSSLPESKAQSTARGLIEGGSPMRVGYERDKTR